MARKYFGLEDPLGKTVRIDDKDCEVTGIVGDPPANTQFQHDILMSVRSEIETGGVSTGLAPRHRRGHDPRQAQARGRRGGIRGA